MFRPRPDLDRRFNHHPPRDQQKITAHETVRAAARTFAQTIVEHVPPSPERDRALDAVDDALSRANAGIARGASPGPCRCNPRPHTKSRALDKNPDG